MREPADGDVTRGAAAKRQRALLFTADEAFRLVGIALAVVLGDARIRTQGPGELDVPGLRLVVDVFGGDEPDRGNTLLDPLLERKLNVVERVARRRQLLPDTTEAVGAGTCIAMRHPWRHEQAIKLLRARGSAAGGHHTLVVFGT